MKLRKLFTGGTLTRDIRAGVVLGVESVPDGLAQGLLAGVNPVFGLHGYMVGTFTAAFVTSSAFMTVQATGAMSIIVADVDAVVGAEDPSSVVFTLSILTGLVMLLAGLLRLGTILRFVSNAVMVGFISAVGLNIVLGQLDDFTGYAAEGGNRIARVLDLVLNLGQIDPATIAVGVTTVVLIVALERTPLGALGMVVAVGAASVMVPVLDLDVARLADIADIPSALPRPQLPDLGVVPALLIPAVSLAFVGLVQGAGISASFPNPDGNYPEPSRDFIGQGVANMASGAFQGMPVGGSMSATALVKEAGARTRLALVIAGLVMAVVVLVFGSMVEAIAMPALAGLLIVVGIRTIKPERIGAVAKTGAVQATVMAVTFTLTMVIALQYAVLVGVGISMILFIINRSNRVTIKQWEIGASAQMREIDPPDVLAAGEVTVLQPYGSLFFASAPVFEQLLPDIEPSSRNSVVIIRLRGFEDLGSTFVQVVARYAEALQAVDSKLMIVSATDRVQDQLTAMGATTVIGPGNIYASDEWLGATLKRAHRDASAWVSDRSDSGDGAPPQD